MAHIHSVYDSDSHFKIDPITRMITNMSSQKVTLVQYDHNSERFTFELPRYVEFHDMSTCNVVEVHYLNGENSGVYLVDDLQISPEGEDVVICSWLISQNATQFVGSLNFLVRFVCTTNGVIDYAWNTAIFSGINISTGLDNSSTVAEDYSDILLQWKAEIDKKLAEVGTGGVVLPENTITWGTLPVDIPLGFSICPHTAQVGGLVKRGFLFSAKLTAIYSEVQQIWWGMFDDEILRRRPISTNDGYKWGEWDSCATIQEVKQLIDDKLGVIENGSY